MFFRLFFLGGGDWGGGGEWKYEKCVSLLSRDQKNPNRTKEKS